ncbi:MAG: nucleotidyltransferase family protein, partial [Thermodesulfovibrionales bacterium]
ISSRSGTVIFLKLISPFQFDIRPEIINSELEEIKSSARKHNLMMLVINRLNRLRSFFGSDTPVGRFLEETRGSYMSAVALSMKQESEEQRIINALKGADVPALVIKGNAIAREIYGDPNCRFSGDSDILIMKKDAQAANRTLNALGYLPEETMPLEYCIHKLHHIKYLKKTGPGIVELHWNFAMPFLFNLRAEGIWKDVISKGQGEFSLSPEMTMISLLIHHHTHSFREMRILVDILWAMHKYDSVIDWRSFLIRLKEIGLLKTTYITMSQLKNLWKDDLEKLRSFRILSEGIKIRKPVMLLRYFAAENMSVNESYKDRLVGRFALDKWVNITGSIVMTLFPLPDAIKGLYNDNRPLFLPYNYARYLCWRIKDWTGAH